MAQIWLSMAIGQLMHQGTTAVLESGAKNNAFKSSVLAPRGQAGVWPEKLPAGGGLVWEVWLMGVYGQDPH